MTHWLLPLSTGNSSCCTVALPLPLPTFIQRPVLYFGLAWRRLLWHMVRLAGLGPWRSGWISSPTFLLLQRLAMHCLGPGKTPYPTYVARSSGQHR